MGSCSVDRWGRAEVAHASRGIPIPVAADVYAKVKIKLFRKIASIVAQRVNFSMTLPLNSAVKSLRYGNFILNSTVSMDLCLSIVVQECCRASLVLRMSKVILDIR